MVSGLHYNIDHSAQCRGGIGVIDLANTVFCSLLYSSFGVSTCMPQFA